MSMALHMTLRMKLRISVALVALTCGQMAWAQTDDCVMVDGRLPETCTHANAGTVVTRAVQPNISDPTSALQLGEQGFSISIDGAPSSADEPGPRRTIAGAQATPDQVRDIDRLLEQMGVQMTYDGLGARPRLSIATSDLRQSFVAGEPVTFRASSNYPAWIARSEVLVRDEDNTIVGRVSVPPNGTATWQMPARDGDDGVYHYTLRAYDAQGRYDETRAQPLTRAATRKTTGLTSPVIAAGEGEDMIARRGIPVRGGAITVSGDAVGAGQSVTVMGEQAPVDGSGRFVMQRILPPGMHEVLIGVDGQTAERDVTIKRSEWFRTGIIDLTVGRDTGTHETWKLGRVAGFAQGTLANGARITASVDTREQELRDMFSNFGRKDPDQTLRQIDARDVFNTFGDDSHMSELAPTSGRFYFRIERDGSHLTWGDFKPTGDASALVRSDRSLYGLSGEYRSPQVTGAGDPRVHITGFAANADSLMQRDILRATGGTAYFLSRQDILSDTQTLLVEVRSATTNRVIETRQLTEGTDYRIDPVQGVVILTSPLSSSVTDGSLISDNPLGDYDVNLVATYEYVPTVGDVDGYTLGGRAETWVNDHLRIGATGLRESTGLSGTDLADNTLLGADILLRDGESRELSFDYAVSEGPGFGSTFSLDGGLDLEPSSPSYGLPGKKAHSYVVKGKTDLAMLGVDGKISGYFDRKQAGFSSPQYNIEVDQTLWGLDGEIRLSKATALTFGADMFRDDDGKRDNKARIGLDHQLSEKWKIETELQHSDKRAGSDTSSLTSWEYGARTDAGARLTWTRDDDLSIWTFGQATLKRDATRLANNRLGLGAQMQLTDRLDLLTEVSGGNLGAASRVEMGYQPTDGTRYNFGYQLDPLRKYDTTDFRGHDNGRFILGATSRVNDRWTYTAENTYSAFGTRPSLTSGYGVNYTPDENWRYEMGLQFGQGVQDDGSTLERTGLSLGFRYSEGKDLSAGLRGEIQIQSSDDPDSDLNRDTYLLSGFYEEKTSQDWRFVSSLDAVVSNSDQTSYRDGRYVEGRLGYAYRPADNDRVNALFSYTFLYDMPGADQVNIDGDTDGPRQRSHILNAAVNYEVSRQWTLGAKYGLRWREQAPRDSDVFVRSIAHLAVLRADYHVVHNWDLMGEMRALFYPEVNTKEYSALIGVYRLVGDNLRFGIGYSTGRVDDDLRTIKAPRDGVFFNVTSQF
ncbi:TonB-dependent receptor [Thioclava indica]|nr:TonB-dependent receptor [Thioclava indica]